VLAIKAVLMLEGESIVVASSAAMRFPAVWRRSGGF